MKVPMSCFIRNRIQDIVFFDLVLMYFIVFFKVAFWARNLRIQSINFIHIRIIFYNSLFRQIYLKIQPIS